MAKDSCPVCPKCNEKMKPSPNNFCKGICKCPKCGAMYIPGECQGIFIPASFIGIHNDIVPKSFIGIH